MVTPNLIHYQVVEISQRIEVAAPDIDDVFDEPVEGVDATYDPPVTLKAQVAYDKFLDSNPEVVSDDPVTTGHLTFRVKDLNRAGITIARGDKIVSISGNPVDLFIIEPKPRGHYKGGPTLIFAEFMDRRVVPK